MEIATWQIILLTLYAFIAGYDNIGTAIGFGRPLVAGFFAGLIMGDVKLGLEMGATLQLMILGVATFGGASIPDYMVAAVVGTALTIISGKGIEFGLTLAIPVGLLMIQLDVVARFANTFFLRKAEKAAAEGDLRTIERMNLLGIFSWGISRSLPVFIFLVFGAEITEAILKFLPTWLMTGLKVAGGMLPAVGIAVLLRYLPIKDYWAYMLIGFVLAAYIGVPMLGVAILGVAFGYLVYQKSGTNVVGTTSGQVEGGIYEDE